VGFYRVSDLCALAVVQCVVSTHHTLQLGKLADHVGEQVGLRQPRRAFGLFHIAVQLLRDRARQLADPLHALELAAQLVVIDHGSEALDAVDEPGLAILIVEELRIRQPRPQHTLVAGDDVPRIAGLEIADDQKAIEQLAALGIEQGEIFLMLLHRQDQAFLRHGEERFIETACVDRRAFDQRCHFVQQRFIVSEAGRTGLSLQKLSCTRSPRLE
jgi:hypothetical protein